MPLIIELGTWVIQEVIDEDHRIIRYISRSKDRALRKANRLRMITTNKVEVYQYIDDGK